MELQVNLPNSEITRIFSVIRFLLPESVIKISGGRETNLDDAGEELLQSGGKWHYYSRVSNNGWK